MQKICPGKALWIFYASFLYTTNSAHADLVSPSDVLLSPLLANAPEYPQTPLPPELRNKQLTVFSSEFTRTGNFGHLDLSVRDISAAFYQSVYSASENTPIGWTGNLSGCDAGNTNDAFKNAVLTRINWYRAMAGIPDNISFFTGIGSYSEKAQEAALLMSSNNSLNHFPSSNWDCYSDSGSEAARNSNLSLGRYGWDAIDGQMIDNGSNNSAVGHRRWILHPQTQLMGIGDVPTTNNAPKASSLWVFDSHTFDSRPATRDTFVAWPPPGYVPYQVVPPRWSFAYPSADFSSATVIMRQAGQSVNIELEPIKNNVGENTLVWVPLGLNPDTFNEVWPKPLGDTTYTVSIENVNISGNYQDFTYQVNIFDPADQGTPALKITGPVEINVSGADYSHETMGFGEAYQLREIQINAYKGGESAEDDGARIIDSTDSAYNLMTTQTSAEGRYAFHLAHTELSTQSFEIDRTFILADNSRLEFSSRLGWASNNQLARVQISINDSVSWNDLYVQSGTGGAGESDFSNRSISLSDYAHRAARFRVIYELNNGSYFPQSSTGVGFYIDNIELIDAQEMGAITLSTLDNSGVFSYLPSMAGEYGLQVQSVPWNGLPGLDWGPVYNVHVNSATNNNCNGESVTISYSFRAGQSVTCTATNQIVTNGIVKVPSDASVSFSAPYVKLNSGFHAEAGAEFTAVTGK